MDVPVAFILQLLAADEAFAFLLQPKFQPTLITLYLLYHLTLSAFFKVEFPLRVIRVGCTFDLDVSSQACLARLVQTNRTDFARSIQDCATEHLTSTFRAGEVLPLHPRDGLLAVAATRPSPSA